MPKLMQYKAFVTWLPCVALLLLFLPGCMSDGSFLGYNVGPAHNSQIRTVKIPIFQNTTFDRDVEFPLTEAVVKRIQTSTPWKIQQQGNADAELRGTIRSEVKSIIVQNELNEVRSGEYSMLVEIRFLECQTGCDLLASCTGAMATPADLPNNDPLSPPSRQAVAKPILLRAHARFAPELGQSYESARQKVINDLAVQIVNRLEMNW